LHCRLLRTTENAVIYFVILIGVTTFVIFVDTNVITVDVLVAARGVAAYQ